MLQGEIHVRNSICHMHVSLRVRIIVKKKQQQQQQQKQYNSSRCELGPPVV